MATLMITCPSCSSQFEPGNAFMKDFEIQARQKMAAEWHKLKLEVEKDKKEILHQKELLEKQQQQQEHELQLRLDNEKLKLKQELQDSIRKSVAADYQNHVEMLETACAENEEKLKEARRKELEFMHKEQQLKMKEAELEIELQRKLL